MGDENRINPGHTSLRQVLRFVGPLIFLIGLILTIIGIGSFFVSFGSPSFDPPRFFWCAFLGMPLLFVGGAISQFAFLGAMSRFAAAETAPVAKDTFNYMAKGTQDGVRNIATAIRQGITEDGLECPVCHDANDMDAKFCDSCGESLADSKVCSNCSAKNNKDARFCDECGQRFFENKPEF